MRTAGGREDRGIDRSGWWRSPARAAAARGRAARLGACGPGEAGVGCAMTDALREPVKKKVGGSLARLPLLERLEMLRRNAQPPPTPPCHQPSNQSGKSNFLGASQSPERRGWRSQTETTNRKETMT